MFSPYYAWSGRKNPDDHVCMNIALYGPNGSRWTMTERSYRAAERSKDRYSIGPSCLRIEQNTVALDFSEWSLPWPPKQFIPKKVSGSIKLELGAITPQIFDIDGKGDHRWWPIAPSSRIHFSCDDGAFPNWQGHGYMDSNWGIEGIENGFHHWDWARGDDGDGGSFILYDTVPRDKAPDCLSLHIAEDGTVDHCKKPTRSEMGRGLWGVMRHGHADSSYTPQIIEVFEDGPFYCRSKVKTRLYDRDLILMHESLSGDRFAKPWVKALLPWRMPRRKL